MEKGLNSNVTYEGVEYHIQTEDWGVENCYLISQVFREGVVERSVRVFYKDIFEEEGSIDKDSIQFALKIQHQHILDLLLSGKLL